MDTSSLKNESDCLADSLENVKLNQNEPVINNDINTENSQASACGEKEEGMFGESEGEDYEDVQDDIEEIDEEKLKEIEDKLTEEEKQKRKEDSQKLKIEGNDSFKAEQYDEACRKYTEALLLCPLVYPKDRSVLYANRGAAWMKKDVKVRAIKDCSKALELDERYMKALVRRAQLYESVEKLDEALEDYKKIVEMDPGNREAVIACMRLPDQINERNEKLKNEVFGKLKDLGNMILKPFGLSTENFKMQQDPNSGSYSVNFQQGGQQ